MEAETSDGMTVVAQVSEDGSSDETQGCRWGGAAGPWIYLEHMAWSVSQQHQE